MFAVPPDINDAARARAPCGKESMSEDSRRFYKITGVLGEGGFGRVYRARLEGAEGFLKDVAVKLLSDDCPSEEMLRRFRDESRILGLVRDRAVITVDAPTRLGGRWAVVMELVEGTTASHLLRRGLFPPRVACEVVQEVSRALHRMYNHPGPDGSPLKLLHRDIKPPNIQITMHGDVKILDFGVARAEYGNRESKTTTHIAGTYGYIAPERILGVEGPAADIYSLGIVLRALVTGKKPSRKTDEEDGPPSEPVDPDVARVMLLAKSMVRRQEKRRPSAKQVEDRCRELVRELDGPLLRDWAEEHVPAATRVRQDDLVGTVLSETMATVPVVLTNNVLRRADSETTERRMKTAAFGVFVAGSSAVAVLCLVVVGLTFVFLQLDLARPERVTVAEPQRIDEPVVVPSEPAVVPVEEPDPTPEPPATPIPVPKPPPPTPTVQMYKVILGSTPMGAKVTVDGEAVGETPLMGVSLTTGEHRIGMKLGDGAAERVIRVGKRQPKRYIWKGGDEWESFF